MAHNSFYYKITRDIHLMGICHRVLESIALLSYPGMVIVCIIVVMQKKPFLAPLAEGQRAVVMAVVSINFFFKKNFSFKTIY